MPPANVLLITSDQQHWSMLGAHRSDLKTPHLERLCREGTRFDRAYCPNPTCTPTRASIITGLYPSQHGAYTLGTKLPESVPTVGQSLSAAGFDTALIGKAHFQPLASTPQCTSLEAYPTLQDLDFWRTSHGPFYGFDHIELARNHTDEAHVGQHYALWMQDRVGDRWRDYFRPPTGRTPAQRWTWNIPESLHYNTWITERSIARLDHARRSGRPSFLWASFFDPHPSYLVPEPWASMYDPARMRTPEVRDDVAAWPTFLRKTREEKPDFSAWSEKAGHAIHGGKSHRIDPELLRRDIATYYGMTSCLDHSVGVLLDHLDRTGQAENTLVIFTSDHGHFFGQHGLDAKGPFHFEDGIRVPMIVRCPGRVAAGRVSHDLQSLVDLAPTLLEAGGLDVPGFMSGRSQWDVWQARGRPRTEVLLENRHQPTRLNLRTMVTARHKLTVWQSPAEGELYDLEADPDETRNLWDRPECAGLRSSLLEQMVRAEMDKEPYSMPRISVA